MPTQVSSDTLTLRFGDIVISLIRGDQGEVQFPLTYFPFLSDDQPEVTLRVHQGRIPDPGLETLVFDSGGNWSLYRSDGQWVIPIRPTIESALQQVVILEPDFCSGEAYIASPNTTLYPYPLAYPLDEILVINLLSRGRGVLLHACGVSDGGRGILFAGTSGAGKSTLATLWEGQGEVTLLSDDRVIIRKRDGRFWIYGTPWHGDARVASPEAMPLEQIFLIQHASENSAVPLSPLDAASRLLVRSFPTFWDAEGMAFTLEFLSQLSQAVPCYELGFVPNKSAVDFVRCLT